MHNNTSQIYEFISMDKKKTMKVEFHSDIKNNIIFGVSDQNNDIYFSLDLEDVKKIKDILQLHIKIQENLTIKEQQNQLQDGCLHLRRRETHPYGWLVCIDCEKLLT